MTDYQFDNDVAAYIDKVNAAFPADSSEVDAEEQRHRYRELCARFDAPWPEGVDAIDGTVAGLAGDIPIRRYKPLGAAGQGCLIYFHGGGWVVGDLESHNGICAEIAARTGTTVIAVDYRLAPEDPYPAAHEDCWSVLVDVATYADHYEIDSARIGISGDSAGANIAAGLCFRARDMEGPGILAQFLIYGAFGGRFDLPSYIEHADAPMLTTSDMRSYHRLYCGDDELPPGPLASPLSAESFNDLPAAFIQPAAVDPLRDDSVEFARTLSNAGVDVELSVEHGLTHGWLRARHSTVRGGAAFDRLCAAIVEKLR